MAEIHDHAEPVHFLHHRHAKFGQAVALWCIGCAIRPVERFPVGQRHIARAERIGLPKHSQRIADRMAAFHTDQRCDAALFLGCVHIRYGQGQLQVVRILIDQTVHDVDLFDNPLHRLEFRQLRVDPDRPELSANPALPEPRQVSVHGFRTRPHGRDGVLKVEL